MDRGDGSFIMHESFKDLRARRAEQEAYRKALEEQIMERKKMQEEERQRERNEGNRKGTLYVQQQQQQNQFRIDSITTPKEHNQNQSQQKDAMQNGNGVAVLLPPLPVPSPTTTTPFKSPKTSSRKIANHHQQQHHHSPKLTQSPSAKNSPHHHHSPAQQQHLHVPTTTLPDDHLPSPVSSSKFQGGGKRTGRMLHHNLNQAENFNEPHPAAFDGNHAVENYNDCCNNNTNALLSGNDALVPPPSFSPTGNGSATIPVPPPNIPPECLKYMQQVMPGFTLPATPMMMNPSSPQSLQKNLPQKFSVEEGQGHNSLHSPHPHRPTNIIPAASSSVSTSSPSAVHDSNRQSPLPSYVQTAAGPSPNIYNGITHTHAFSSGSTSESSSYEDVSMNNNNNDPVQVPPKVHVSQTSEQLQAGVTVSRSQYRAELQKQIEARKQREEEQKRKEQEAEDRIQEKIRIEQEKMQKEYEEELRKQQEKELEAEKKRLIALGKHSEIVKAVEKLKTMQKKLAQRPPSQLEAWNVRNASSSRDGPEVTVVEASESKETIDSICDFFDATMNSEEESTKKYVNLDDRVVPAVAKRLREEALRKQLEDLNRSENSFLEDSMNNEKSFSAGVGAGAQSMNNNISRISSSGSNRGGIEGQLRGKMSFSQRTARISSNSQESFECDTVEPPSPSMNREMAIRSAPCSTNTNNTNSVAAAAARGSASKDQDFLSSLKSYLEDEKTKLMERIQAKGSKSNEEF